MNLRGRNSGAAAGRRSVPHWRARTLLLLAGLLKAQNRLHILFEKTSVSSKVCPRPRLTSELRRTGHYRLTAYLFDSVLFERKDLYGIILPCPPSFSPPFPFLFFLWFTSFLSFHRRFPFNCCVAAYFPLYAAPSGECGSRISVWTEIMSYVWDARVLPFMWLMAATLAQYITALRATSIRFYAELKGTAWAAAFVRRFHPRCTQPASAG